LPQADALALATHEARVGYFTPQCVANAAALMPL
jgi:hypothetical protein